MKILLCSIGSRGDIQPFLILGDYFAKQGHQVKVVSAELYAPLAAVYQVEYHSFAGDYASIINDEEMKKRIGKNPFTIRRNLREKVFPILESALQSFYDWSQWADVILYHPKTLMDSFGEDIQQKLIKAYVVPLFTPTRAFRNPILSFLPLPSWLSAWTYQLSNRLMSVVKTPIHNFRAKNKLAQKTLWLDTPIVYGVSPHFLAQPKDYPHNHHFTGFWLPTNQAQKLSPILQDFLSDNHEVLTLTFGSMPYRCRIPINELLEAILDHTSLKVLVVKGWGLQSVLIQKHERILAVDKVPFAALFPRVDYLLHHGGAGTTATALRAGLPQLICPVLHPFGDQYFWGKQIAAQGLGPSPIPLAKLRLPQLIANIKQLTQENYKIRAKALQTKLEAEDGLANCLALIEAHWKQQEA